LACCLKGPKSIFGGHQLKQKGACMKSIFPEPLRNLPEADIPLEGLSAWLSRSENHQIIFMEFHKDVDLPEHTHNDQVGIVIRGKIDLTISGDQQTFQKGDIYHIPKGVVHSGKIYAGYADITFFNEPGRYSEKSLGEQIRKRAEKNFSKGYNCPECIFEAVLHFVDTGLPKEILKVATGFGGGIGLFGDTCGAVTGAILAVSAVHGRSRLPEGDRKTSLKKGKEMLYGKPGLYRLFNQIPNRIREKHGDTLCRGLTSQWQDEWLCRDHALFCRSLIGDAAEIAAEMIFADKTELSTQPFGRNVENLKDDAS
jgi:C_GCAxxG_C_C family probable redox protein